MSTLEQPHLLIVDDEPELAEFLATVAEDTGYRCTVLTEPGKFAQAIERDVDLIMLDLMMPDVDGVELLRVLARVRHTAGVILMSGFDHRVLATARALAQELGLQVRGQLQKPIRAAELEAFLRTTAAPVAPAKLRPDTPPVTEHELATAIGERQLEIHYQPQISIANRAFVGVEALVRWRHPTRGLVYPNDFIPLAERSGLIDALSWVTYEQSMSDLRALCETCGPLHLSLNLSACSLHDLATPERLVELAARTGLPVSQLVVEITESSLMSELSSALDVLTRIRLRGIALSIDDFGTGYSMMDQLRRVPASELKIDRSFISDATHDERALVIVEKTIEIGRRLQMRVVAEGVETTEQAGMLRALGCEMAQGYLFSRPVPLAALRTWASAWPAAGRAA